MGCGRAAGTYFQGCEAVTSKESCRAGESGTSGKQLETE